MKKVIIEVFVKENGQLGYDVNVGDDVIDGQSLEAAYADCVALAVSVTLDELHDEIAKNAKRLYQRSKKR